MMKSVLRILELALLVLAVSCKKEAVILDPAPETKTLHYKTTVQTEVETRATVGSDLKYAFEEDDRVYVESVGDAAGKLYGFLSLSVTGGVGKTRALFEGDLTCAEDFTPSYDTPVKLVLVSAEDHLHTVSDGKVTGTDYNNKWESSLQEAVQRLSHFTSTGDFGSTSFTLAQQSSFLIVSLAFESNVGTGVGVNAKLYKSYGSESQSLLHEVSCETANIGGEIEASWVAAFPDDTEVTDASLVVTASGVNVPPLKMANATLQANTYYSFQRDTYLKDYFAVEAIQNNTVVTFNYATSANGIQYSLDGYQWNKYENPITLEETGDKVYFRGKATSLKNTGNTVVSSNEAAYVYGDIMFLMCEGAYKPRTAIPSSSAFKEAFKNATWLQSSTEEGKTLKLSATELTNSCYESMFYDCVNLTSAPALPATVLPQACYKTMFNGCTGITSAPAISATSVGVSSCDNMFNGCTAMTTVPGLTVSNVGQKGCYRMFYECTSLNSVSFTLGSLAAVTTGSHEGCGEMFSGCTSLTSAEGITLTAPTLYDACYYSMFDGCTNLASAPALPATVLPQTCYKYMFRGTGVVSAPAISASSVGESSCEGMFSGCTALTTVPGLTVASVGKKGCYQMFKGCKNLGSVSFAISSFSSVETAEHYGCREMFYGCKSITSADGITLAAPSLTEGCYYSMFEDCGKLASAPDLPASALVKNCYRQMFKFNGDGNNELSLLNFVRCMATSGINTDGSTTEWLQSVSDTGTFIYSPSAIIGDTGWPRGKNGIPTNWNCYSGVIPEFPDNPFDPEEPF